MSQPVDSVRVAVVPDFKAFAAELRSGVDAGLRQVASSVNAALAGVEREVAQVGRAIGTDFTRGGLQAEAAIRGVQNESSSAFRKVEQDADRAASGMSSRLSGAFSVIKTGLLTLGVGVATGLGAITAFGLKSAATLEQTQVAFNSLLGSVDAGQKAFKQLQDFAAATPFEFKDVAGAASRFFAFSGAVGLSKDQVTQFLTTIGSVASVTGGGAQALNSITLAMGQIASAGKVTLDNLNQISEALPGFSGVAAIASGTGKTTAQVMQEISAGSIDATTGIQALLKGMQTFPGAAGAMEAQAKTLLGVFSTFKDTTSQALVAGFAPVIPAIKDSLTGLTPILGGAIAKIAPALGQLVAGFMPAIGQIVSALTSILGPLLEGLGVGLKVISDSGALTALGDAFGEIAKALEPLLPVLGQVIAALAMALVPIILQLAPVINDVVPVVAELVMALLPLVPVLGELLAALIPVIEPLIRAAAAFLRWASINGLVPIVTLLAQGIGFMASAVGELAKWLQQIDWDAVGKSIGGAFADAWHAVSDFFSGMGDFFSSLPGKIGDALAALPGLLSDAATAAFDAFFHAIGLGIGIIIRGFMEFPGRVHKILTDMWDGAVAVVRDGIETVVGFFETIPGRSETAFSRIWTRAKTVFITGIKLLVDTAMALPGKLLGIVEGLPKKFGDIGKSILDGLINGIKDNIGRTINAVKRAMGDIVGGAKDALGIHSPSTVFAEEVGAEIPPGIGKGAQDAMPDLHAMLASATAGLAVPPAAGAATSGTGAVGALFGPGSIVINFNGSVPTQQQASQVGQAVGSGIVDSMTRRGIATAARTV